MKKTWLLIIAAMILLLCCGCGKEDTVVNIDMTEGMPEGMGEGFPGGEIPEFNGEMPEFNGERPEGMPENMDGRQPGEGGKADREQPDGEGEGRRPNITAAATGDNQVIGKVQRIVGNYVTLLIGENQNGSIEYTGEEANYLLPVGMTIGTGDFSSVNAGMVLSLTFDGDNITAVSIVSR